jgi:hypothetical protein
MHLHTELVIIAASAERGSAAERLVQSLLLASTLSQLRLQSKLLLLDV